jgi:predicted DNA-binding antitoxin AbrB/MazE fold protein
MTRQVEVVYEAGLLRPLEPLPFRDRQHLTVTVTDESPGRRTFNNREREQQWLRTHGAGHAGDWVALDGDRLVAHGKNGREVLEQAWSDGIQEPLVIRIPDEPELPFGGW